jgi:hypothetical protein
MSVIKRLGNVARGKVLDWSRDDGASIDDDVARELAELEEAAAAAASARAGARALQPTPAPTLQPADPVEARRRAVFDAHAAGVITEEERDDKLAAIDAERWAPPTPKKRTL